MKLFINSKSEPYRILFPIGVMYCLWGVLIWLPQIFSAESYPVLAHRYLMLNGFSASFIAGFLMTAVPKFSQTKSAEIYEISSFILITFIGMILAYLDLENWTFVVSSLQACILLSFLLIRISNRKVNPPYSFIFIFVGLLLWIFSGFMSALLESDAFKIFHYEGSITAIILGVGSRLIPGIMGHVEIVQTQRSRYENEKPFIQNVPIHFFLMMIFFVGSYFVADTLGPYVRALIVAGVGIYYWKLTSFPINKSALTWSIWTSCWLIVFSFALKAVWQQGFIHASHSFFINGTLLLTFMIATRVLQSHGPKDANLENSKMLYLTSFLIIFAAATRVSAFLMPANYLRHLGYSSILLALAVIIWSWKYLRFVFVK